MDIYLRNLIRLASAAPESASSAASSPPASPHSTAAAAHGPEAAAAVEAHVWHSIVATSHHRRVHLMAPEVHTDIDSRTDRPDREYAGQSLEIQYSTARLQTMTDIGRRTHTHTHRERERAGKRGNFLHRTIIIGFIICAWPGLKRVFFMPGWLVLFALTLMVLPRNSVSLKSRAFATASASWNSIYAKPFGLPNLSVRMVTRLTIPQPLKCTWSSSGFVP